MIRKEMLTMPVKWKKIIIKDKIKDANGEHVIHRVYIAQCSTETGYYLISPFSDFLNEFITNKTTSVNMAADVIVRFLNYLYFTAKKSIYEMNRQDAIEFINRLNINEDTQRSYTSYLTKFYYFAARKLPLKYISLNDFLFKKDIKDHEVMENFFMKVMEEKKKVKIELIHNIKKEYLYTFIKTAVDETPDIAFGVFLQCFGGLRKSEVVSLEYQNIAITDCGGMMTMQVTLRDKDLREDISTAFIAKCKRNRIQTIIPAFGDMLWVLYEEHKEKYQKGGYSAVFLDANGKAMTDATYYKRFKRLKEAFIHRLEKSDDFSVKSYGFYLRNYKWSTHICRGIFSNLIAESTDNIMEIATWRNDRSLSSALSYLVDKKQTGEKVVQTMDEMYKEERRIQDANTYF